MTLAELELRLTALEKSVEALQATASHSVPSNRWWVDQAGRFENDPLRDTGLPLCFCDMPGANELTVGMMAVVAEEERKMISRRTKDALQAAKRRGVKLGSARADHWKGREERRAAGAIAGGRAAGTAHRKAADESYADLYPTVTEMRTSGKSLQEIADELNKQGHSTRRGKPWNPMQVSRVLKRAS